MMRGSRLQTSSQFSKLTTDIHRTLVADIESLSQAVFQKTEYSK